VPRAWWPQEESPVKSCNFFVFAILAGAPVAVAQPTLVEMRFVERTGQLFASPSDPDLDIAVQVRVLQGQSLNRFGFNMVMPGEADAWGTLNRDRISNVDYTYFPGVTITNAVGLGGLARQYTYTAAINANFNGLLNTSAGPFTNTPTNQEIGGVYGTAWASQLTNIPGIDGDGDGNPDTWSGNGTGQNPPQGATAAINPGAAEQYLAQGQFIDVYRFRYTVTDFHQRVISLTAQSTTFATFTELGFSNGIWGAAGYIPGAGEVSLQTLEIPIIPATPTVVVILAGCGVGMRRRKRD
jgi:hypothetical protein